MAAPIIAAAAKWAAKKGLQKGAQKAQDAAGGSQVTTLIFVAVGGAAAVGSIGFIVIALLLMLVTVIGGGAVEALQAEECDQYGFSGTTTETISAAASADIPKVALDAYMSASKTTGVDWVYIAALGKVESDHGRHGGRTLDANGDVGPSPILGVPTKYGRAEGPMQFLTATFKAYGKDGNNDGKVNAQNIYDAALAAGFYLKASGAPGDMEKAIFAYNHATWYVNDVVKQAEAYRAGSTATDPTVQVASIDDLIGKDKDTGTGGPATAAQVAATVAGFAATVNTPQNKQQDKQGPKPMPAQPYTPPNKVENGGGGGGSAWTLPVPKDSYTLTNRWGMPASYYASGYHTGLDYAAPEGTPVFAAAAGKVIARPDQASWAGANFLTIDHGIVDGQGVMTWYAHLSKALVTAGDVFGGDQIGEVGDLGNASGPHLHFEVRINGQDVDPMIWLANAGAPDTTGIASDGCGPTGSSGIVGGNGAWGGYENGKIPTEAMCKVSFYDTYFECNAAATLEELNKDYTKEFGRSIGPVDGYRDYAGQVQCQKEKGDLCATPGTSNHGWGLAADLDGGGIDKFDTPQHTWMAKNALKYGWVLPDWAQATGSKPEPWHWEFAGSGNQSIPDEGTPPKGPLGKSPSASGAVTFMIGSWNVLGASHTEGPNANRAYLPDSPLRMTRAVGVMRRHGLNVVGLQEFQPGVQQARFRALMPGWAIYNNLDNAIAWNTAKWQLIGSDDFRIPYFSGASRMMPMVRLENRTNGVEIIVISVHNPANARGPAQQWRDEATSIEKELTTNLASSGTPVYLTGDMNDRERFFCPITRAGVMHAATGGSNTNGNCITPSPHPVNWLMGSRNTVTFHSGVIDDSADVDYSSDHPIVVGRTTARN